MLLGYTAHSIWDSSPEQIGRTQAKVEKKGVGQGKETFYISSGKLWDLCLSV